MCWFYFFYIFFVQKILTFFFTSPYKVLLQLLPEPTGNDFSLPYIIVLDKLCEVFGCSIINDFMSTMFAFSKGFGF